jgi:hypothetical protein
VPADDLLICNDELACLYLAGRVDGWLLPDADLRGVCSIERAGVATGLYAGSRVLADENAVRQFVSSSRTRSATIVVLDTPKFGVDAQLAIVQHMARTAGVAVRPCGSRGAAARLGI